MKNNILNSALKYLLPPVVSLAILFTIFTRLDAEKVWHIIISSDWKWILVAVAITSLLPIFGTLRWRTVVVAMGCPIKFGRSLQVTLAAFPLNTFLPSKAGDFAKAAFLRKQGGFVPLAGSVLFERLVDVIVLTTMSIFGSIWLNQPVTLLLALCCATVTIGVILSLAFAHRLRLPGWLEEKAEDFGKAARVVTNQRKTLALVILWSLLNWLGVMVETYCIFRAIGGPVPLTTILAVLPLAIFVGLLPITVSGMGTRDGALVLLLTEVVVAESALAAGLLYTVISYWFLALIGLPFFLWSLSLLYPAKEPKPSP
ncbi:MAG: flippase-like domain-containing protein [Sedimentisphaerales bacterium]|nr:flippase-like domain-containing protein [Sedimentisphaerales bacterium]